MKLADVLGHSSVNTTRIYTMESGDNHRKILDKMKLAAIRSRAATEDEENMFEALTT